MSAPGLVLFARYAYAPNELGYCGPAETQALFDLGVTGETSCDMSSIARRFSGTWQYAAILAELAGIDDPLDEQVMRAYWTGGPLLHAVNRVDFGTKLLDRIGAEAGHYWGHLTPDLLPEAVPTHGFHVFGVYPWTRLLADVPDQALSVVDNCRIRWGQVTGVSGDHVLVSSQRLVWDGAALTLGEAATERVRYAVDGAAFVSDPAPGDWLAMHWDSVCERLTPDELHWLRECTEWQLQVTNERLVRDAEAHRTVSR
jgi:hypothetical protein